ncbi:MAG: FG-GAP repeat domain-containing protein [Planctomycetota bacterium]
MRFFSTISAVCTFLLLLLFPTIASAQAPFGGISTYPTTDGPVDLAIGDYNNDALVDAAYVHSPFQVTSNAIGIQLALPGGGFGPSSIFFTPTPLRFVLTTDFNNDGDLDLYEVHGSDSSVLLGNGDGTFGAPMALPAIIGGGTVTPRKIAAHDQNADGNKDVLMAGSFTAILSVQGADVLTYRGNGDGTFTNPNIKNLIAIATGLAPSQGKFAFHGSDFSDINNDGLLDVAIVAYTQQPSSPGSGNKSQDIFIALADGTGGFGSTFTTNIYATWQLGPTPPAQAPFLFDADGDINLDVILSLGNVYLGAGNGNITLSPSVSLPVPGIVAVADLNADGLPDVQSAQSTLIQIRLAQPSAFLSDPVDYFGLPAVADLYNADVDQDGLLDFFYTSFGINSLVICKGNGDGGIQGVPASHPAESLTFGNANAVCTTSADFDLDGKRDLITCDATTARIALGDGSGGFGVATMIHNGSSISACTAGDINRDGFVDIAIADSTANLIQILFGAWNGTLTNGGSLATGAEPVAVALADLNFDGYLDIVTGNAAGNSISYIINTHPGFATNVDVAAGGAVNNLAVADLNHDGFPDAAATRTGVLSVGVFIGSLSGFAPFTNFATSVANLALAIGDINNDEHFDIVTLHTTGSSIGGSRLLGDGLGGFGAATTIQTVSGTLINPPRQAVLADLGGDGFVDLIAAGIGPVAHIWNNDQFGTFRAPASLSGLANATNPRERAAVADFNSDGRHDLFLLGDTDSTLTLSATTVPYGTLPFGVGTPGCSGVHGIAANVAPRINTPGFIISSTNGPPRMLGLGLYGDASYPLGQDAFALGFLTYVDPYLSNPLGFFEFITDRNGAAYGLVPIANDVNLVGMTFTAQTFMLWTDGCQPTPLGLSSSRALLITIQN